MKINKIIIACLGILALTSCVNSQYTLPDSAIDYKQPTVAVLKFENRASFYRDWELGEGFQEVLVNELIQTKRYNVVTRTELDAVIDELRLQDSDMMLKQGKARYGHLHNVKYLIKGTITDFAHVSGGYLGFITSGFGLRGDGSTAQVTVVISVIEVETGRIVSSESLTGTASAYSIEVKGEYDNVAFGGSLFKKTPLGEATTEVIAECITKISEIIARDKWYPQVIKLEGKKVFVTGGETRAMQVGDLYQGIKQGEALLDPETGIILGREKQRTFGRIKITKVFGKYAEGIIIDGDFNAKDLLDIYTE